MKNFSEATAIKSKLELEVVITLKPSICGLGRCSLVVNRNQLLAGPIEKDTDFKCSVPISDPIDIKIQFQQLSKHGTINVEVRIDNREVLPLYYESLKINTHLSDTGIWSLVIPNFYPLYHELSGQGWII